MFGGLEVPTTPGECIAPEAAHTTPQARVIVPLKGLTVSDVPHLFFLSFVISVFMFCLSLFLALLVFSFLYFCFYLSLFVYFPSCFHYFFLMLFLLLHRLYKCCLVLPSFPASPASMMGYLIPSSSVRGVLRVAMAGI